MRSALLDRSTPPAAGAVRLFHFPPFLRRRLANGLEVLAARRPAMPVLSLEMVVPAGAQNDPAGMAGLATLTGAVIDEGTRRRSSLEIAAHVEQLGGYLAIGTRDTWRPACCRTTAAPASSCSPRWRASRPSRRRRSSACAANAWARSCAAARTPPRSPRTS